MTTTLQWTPVAEAYPPPFTPVLVALHSFVVVIGVMEWDGDKWGSFFEPSCPNIRQDFTHWTALSGLKLGDGGT